MRQQVGIASNSTVTNFNMLEHMRHTSKNGYARHSMNEHSCHTLDARWATVDFEIREASERNGGAH